MRIWHFSVLILACLLLAGCGDKIENPIPFESQKTNESLSVIGDVDYNCWPNKELEMRNSVLKERLHGIKFESCFLYNPEPEMYGNKSLRRFKFLEECFHYEERRQCYEIVDAEIEVES